MYDVTTYGAVGDGATDDTAAIQSALTACGNAGGGTVYIPPGTYLLTAALNFAPDIRVLGEGYGSILSAAGNHRLLNIETGDHRCTVERLHLIGSNNPAHNLQYGIWIWGANNVKVLNNWVENMGYDGILPAGQCDGTEIRGNFVINCHDDGINPGSVVNAGVTNTIVVNNHVTGCANAGIHVSEGSKHTLVDGNFVSDCDHGIDMYSTDHVKIMNNVVQDCTHGIRTINYCEHFQIRGNHVSGAERGIFVYGGSRFWEVEQNMVDSAVYYGVIIHNIGTQVDDDGDIRANRVRGGCAYDAVVLGNSRAVRVTDNRIEDINGVYAIRESQGSTGNEYRDNRMDKPVSLL